MKCITVSLIIIFLCNCLQGEHKTVGYLPYYRNLDMKKVELLTDLVIFSAEPKKDGSLKYNEPLINLLEKSKTIKNCRKFICVGGWAKSDNFKHITLNEKLRKSFIDKIFSLVKLYELDGVDYDWEHPKNKDEEQAYELLIKETAARGIKVSMAAASWQKFSPEVFKHLYALNIMSYDHPKEHSTLEQAKEDVLLFVKKGCPLEKINLGVPFYGRHIENRKNKSFNKITIEDETTDIVEGFYFNNVDTLKKKIKLIKEMKLSGIMIWEIEQDNKDMLLLKTINKTISSD